MNESKFKVLYIAGSGRCGSTTLAQLLGELEDFANVGEAWYLFNRRMQERQIPCSCGNVPGQCDFWSPVVETIEQKEIDWATRWVKLKYFPFFSLLRGLRINRFRGIEHFVSAIDAVYREMVKITGARVIVDSSKHPLFGLLLTLSNSFDVYTLHLVRDARGVVGSWNRRKSYLRARSVWNVSMQWVTYNVFARYVPGLKDRIFQLRWEDFCNDPFTNLTHIVNYLEEDKGVLESIKKEGERTFILHPQHVLSGNPDKLRSGQKVEIRLRKWQLSKWKQALVISLSWPFLWKYGYFSHNSMREDADE